MAGPGLTTTDLIQLGAFVANYGVVAPASVVGITLALLRRGRRPPTWLVPIAAVNVLVVLPQLVVPGAFPEAWLAALLFAQLGGAVAVFVWWFRARRRSYAGPQVRS